MFLDVKSAATSGTRAVAEVNAEGNTVDAKQCLSEMLHATTPACASAPAVACTVNPINASLMVAFSLSFPLPFTIA